MSGIVRHAAPIHLVIVFVGLVLLLTVVGIIGLAYIEAPIPDVLGTVCVASLTGLSALLTPSAALVTNARTDRRASVAGQAAAAAVVEHDGLREVAREGAELHAAERARDTLPGA